MASLLANMFGSSPVQPIEKHVDIAYRCTRELVGFFEAAINQDWAQALQIRETIDTFEHQADDLKKDIRRHLPKSLFMPVPRQDLLDLLLVQDKMANRAKDVSRLVMSRKLKIPEPVAQDFLAFVTRNVEAAKKARKSVRELDELFTAGFGGAEASLVESMVAELDNIETDTDELEFGLRGKLFEIEETLDPVTIMFLYRVIELTGEIADMAERVGRRLELLLSN